MYEIKSGNVHLSYEDKVRYIKLQSNGTYSLCNESEAQGVVVNNEYICHLEGKPLLEGLESVTMEEINGYAIITNAQSAVDELLDVIGGAV